MSSYDLKVLLAFLVLRLLSVLIIQSSFVPDEYWQSLEVSHKMTYGYGHLTWEWDKKIRSCAYPFIIHLLYNILPDSSILIIYAPKFLQAILSATGDFFAYKLAFDYFGKDCALWTALNVAISWFLFYCAPRTITNMAETALTIIGFYFYPWPKSKTVISLFVWKLFRKIKLLSPVKK